MEIRFPTIRLLMNVLMLLVIVVEFSDSQIHNSGFPQVVPNRQQLFQAEPITISCEGLNGLTGWRVMKKINGDVRTCASTWETSTGPCNIINAYPSSDSGEYWCEMGGIQKSNSVNITVTDLENHVILEIPAQPVMQGENVTLHCRKKDANSNYTAKFYKNGISIGSSSSGNIMAPNVSKSDEGLYKCSIADAEESPESWLSVEDSGFPQVVPNRQQFFKSEPITISCEGLNGLTGWRVMKKINGDVRTCASTWEASTGPCKISNAYPTTDSGEYWCEMGGIQKSNSVNVTVTGKYIEMKLYVNIFSPFIIFSCLVC
uniref:Ig-like domain-containing protein n=1 Tax=Oreochromis niloticus TaxID=8128 RepID=A0A669D150_ORENI